MAIIPEGQSPKPKPKSSGQIQALGGKGGPQRPGSTARIKPATVRTSKAEVVASHDDDEASEVRRSVAPPSSATLGLSLRWKIVIGMAAITIATAIIIFITVNSKAVTQLSDE